MRYFKKFVKTSFEIIPKKKFKDEFLNSGKLVFRLETGNFNKIQVEDAGCVLSGSK